MPGISLSDLTLIRTEYRRPAIADPVQPTAVVPVDSGGLATQPGGYTSGRARLALMRSAGDRRLTESLGAGSSPEQYRTSLGEMPRRPRVRRNRVRASAAPRDRALRERRGLGRNRAPDLDEVVLRKWRQDDHGVHTRPAFVLRRARAARPRILMPATASASNGRALPSSSCLRPAPTSERSCAMRASCSRSWASSSLNAARTTSLADE